MHSVFIFKFSTPHIRMDSAAESFVFLPIFNAFSGGLQTWKMWEAVQVIRKTNRKLQGRKWQIWTYNGSVWCRALGFLCSSVFLVIFSTASPSGRGLWDISCSVFFHHVVYFPSLVHLMDGIYRARWGRAKCSGSIKWNPAYFYCLQLDPSQRLRPTAHRYITA